MKNENMTKEQLIKEMTELQLKNAELEIIIKNLNLSSATPAIIPFTTRMSETLGSINNEHHTINDLQKYNLSDLIDMPLLQQVLDSFYVATKIPYAILDKDNNILCARGWQDICTNFHFVCPQTKSRCVQSNSYLFTHLQEENYIGHKCLNGLMDYAAPIIIEGQCLAAITTGQFLNEPPDEGFFCKQAQQYRFDQTAYLEALQQVPIISAELARSTMEYFTKLARVASSMGEKQLRRIEDTEDRFLKALHCIPDPVTITTLDTGRFVDVNDAWFENTGYNKHEIIGRTTSFELDVYLDLEERNLMLKEIQTKGYIRNIETPFRMKSGEIQKYLSSFEMIFIDNKPHLLGVHKDITERKRMEKILKESEEKFSKAFNCNADAMSISTLKEGRYVEVNDAYLKATGYKENEVIGQTVGELGIWAFVEERDIILKQIQEYGSIRNIEINCRNKSGDIGNVLMSAEIIELEGEAHLLVSTRDITERKQIEQQLLLSEDILSKAFSASPIIMGITTLEEERFIKVNKSLCRVTGYSQEEALGKTTLELGFWSDPATSCVIKQMLMVNRTIEDMETCFCTKTGEQRLGLFSAERLDVNGQPCILGIMTDITEQRQIEIEMNRLDRLNMVGEMAASIGHEIRNPMTTVRGYLQLLKQNKNFHQEIEYFDLMIEELDQANSIITEFLSLAKNKIVELRPISLNTIISKLLPLVQARAMSRDQHIKVELNDHLPDLLLDNKEIRQLIINLVNNGMESMFSVGCITIRTFIEKGKVVLAVQDQGHGIDCELLDKLGTPFFTTKEQGTGLGLAVCYRIANRHNAQIDIDTSSTGTTFYVRFPISIVEAAVS